MEKKTILALVDYGTSGIAESLKAPLHHWHKQGHEIWQMGLGYQGALHTVNKEEYPWYERLVPIFPESPTVRFGQNSIANVILHAKPDFIITGFDVWMISYLATPETDPNISNETRAVLDHRTRTFKHIAYFPIDGAREEKFLPPGIAECICAFDVPVTYSRFAQKLIINDVNLHIPCIPIAHDPAVFHPGDKRESRDRLGFPQDRYMIGMVATNQYRKLFGQFIQAVKPICKRHEDVLILPWTNWNRQMSGGHEIPDLLWRADILKQTLNPLNGPGAFTETQMADLYRSLDVLVLLTVGEGAGLPPLRARACGTPVFVSDNTSNTEFSGHDFELIPNSCNFFDPMGSNLVRYNSDTEVLTDRLEELYQCDKNHKGEGMSPLRAEMVAAGIKEMKKYELSRVLPMWDALLEEHS